jgi:hypothetical protein
MKFYRGSIYTMWIQREDETFIQTFWTAVCGHSAVWTKAIYPKWVNYIFGGIPMEDGFQEEWGIWKGKEEEGLTFCIWRISKNKANQK